MSVRDTVSPVMRYGGKARAAPLVWEALGNPSCYVDPFAGSLAVPLRSPLPLRKAIINDLDDMVTNFWRALQYEPQTVAYWADYPTMHTDLVARREWLRQEWPRVRRAMKIDPFWYDAEVAGWWVWAVCNSIDLLRLDFPSEESQEWYAAALTTARSAVGRSRWKGVAAETDVENVWEGAPPAVHKGRPTLTAAGGGLGVQMQRQGIPSAAQPGVESEEVPVLPDGPRGYITSIPIIPSSDGGQGVSMQRYGKVMSKRTIPWQEITAHPLVENAPERPDMRRPHVDHKPGAGMGLNAQRGPTMGASHPFVENAPECPNMSRPRVDPTPSSGTGVQAQRGPTTGPAHQGMPMVPPRPGGQGVSAQRVGQMAPHHPTTGPANQGMPFVALWGGGQGVTAQRTDRTCTKHPPVGAPTENGYVALPPDRLLPENPTPFTGERLTPWLMDLAKKIQRWIILCKDWRDVVHSRCITSTTPSQNNTICGIFLDPPYNRKSVARGQLYSQDNFDVADQVFDWLVTTDKRYGCTPWENPQFRIVLCGYSNDYHATDLPGARVVPWGRGGGMERAGANSLAVEKENPRQEVLILSPACLPVTGQGVPSGENAKVARPTYSQPVLL